MPQSITEKISRLLCEAKDMDPDKIMCPLKPEYVNALPLINGFYIPEENLQIPAWKMFEPYVQVMFAVLGKHLKEMSEHDFLEMLEEAIPAKQ